MSWGLFMWSELHRVATREDLGMRELQANRTTIAKTLR